MKVPPDETKIISYSPGQKSLRTQTVIEMLKDGRDMLNGKAISDFIPVTIGLYPGVAQLKCQIIEYLYPELFRGEQEIRPRPDDTLRRILERMLWDFH